mmetsp:Transcript_4197/g.6367  ORF Transcript_4197/g.6367 Transcript_4197/m.6367 type:complete len:267 (-) Transcript_4197:192-992(-)
MDSKTLTSSLPAEHLRSIASFLSGADAVSFSITCHQINRDLGMGNLDNIYPVGRLSETDCDDKFHLWMKLPLVLEEKVHSVRLNALWKDQGWGNRKGQVAITSSIHDSNPDIVVASGIAPHRAKRLKLEFKVQPGRDYYLMYKVGGGGGHELIVKDVKLSFLIYGALVANMYRSGYANDGLQIALLEAAASSFENALENGRDPDRYLVLALRRFGLPGADKLVDRGTVDSLRDVARLMKEKTAIVQNTNLGNEDYRDCPSPEYDGY